MTDDIAVLERTLALHPQDASVANNLGCLLIAAGRCVEARDVLQRATELAPDFAQAWLNLGVVLGRMGQGGAARAALGRVRPDTPNLPTAIHALLETLLDGGLLDDAATMLSDTLAHVPLPLEGAMALRNLLISRNAQIADTPAVLLHCARLDKQLGMSATAEQCLKHILTLEPGHHEANHALGSLLMETRRFDEALPCFQRLTQELPDRWQAWNDMACCLRDRGHSADAARCMERAIQCRPDSAGQHATLYANLALIHFDLHDYERAQLALDSALALDPCSAEALYTQSMLKSGLGLHGEAEAWARRALAVKPAYPQARLGLALSVLTQGRWREGFAGYELRWVGSDRAAVQTMPTLGRSQWHGAPTLPGSHIAVLAEQGFGDQLQFARLVPMLLAHFQQVTWLVAEPLHRLLAHSLASDRLQIVTSINETQRQQIDFEIPLMSLALALDIDAHSLPACVPYLRAIAADVASWRTRCGALPGRKVGIAWAGKPTLAKDALRSIPAELLAVLARPGISFVSLQQGQGAHALMHSGTHATDVSLQWIDECRDFADTAALIENLDLVIAVDTAVVHLAGALGKPVWLLNRLGSEWRWLADRDDSPWYPNMRIFNQAEFKDWRPTLGRVAQALNLGPRVPPDSAA